MRPTATPFNDGAPWFREIDDYCRRVVSGDRRAAKTEIAACRRFLDDYARAQTDLEFPYAFNFAKAWKVIAFIEQLPHVKGHFAARVGASRLIKLEPWQKFVIANLFGWVRKANGLRRFTVAYIEVPRKNGKSVLAAGIGLYMLCADGEIGAEVYCGACSLSQAGEVFSPAVKMVEATPKLRRAYGLRVKAKSITKIRDGSKFEPVIGKPGDGASPSCAIVDEFHEHDSAALYDTMVTGMGARQQPLMLVITTAGENLFSPCYDMHKDAVRVLLEGWEWPELFAVVYGLDPEDDWTDPAILIKANPNYGVSVGPDFVKASQTLATKKTNKQNAFKTKHLNVWCYAKNAYFNTLNWQKCHDPALNLEDFIGQSCYVCLDLAKKRDLSGKVILFKKLIGGEVHYYVFTRFYLPEALIHEQESDTLKTLYSTWLNEGHLITCPGNEMDFGMIRDDILDDSHHFYIDEVPHDPHGAIHISHELANYGLVPVMMNQHGNTYTLPINELEAAIDAGRIHHDGNPVMAWCIGNVIVHEYRNQNKMPDKPDDDSKIDGAVALLMGLARALVVDKQAELSLTIL
jgi:phage terminase large subunit-like protein